MNETAALLLTGLVVLSAVPVTAGATAQEQVTLTVAVADEGGDPVSGAMLNVTWDGGSATATTRSNGKALVDVPRGADLEVDVRSDDYVRNRPYAVEDASEREEEVTVAEKGMATIEVRNTQGEPVDDAVVRMWHEGKNIVNDRTDRDGQHRTDTIEQGEYRLVVFKEGHFRNSTTVRVDSASVSESLVIERGSVTATFEVSDDHFSPAEPVEGARITVGDIADGVRTLSSGEATVRVPVNSEHEVTVTKDGYEEAVRTLEVEESDLTLGATIQRTPALSIGLSNGQVVVGESVRVTVTDEYGRAVSEATVAVDGEEVGTTDDSGELAVPIEAAGENEITVSDGSLESSATVQGVRAGTATPTETEATTSEGGPIDGVSVETGPGFTSVLAVLALLAVALLAGRRRE